MAKIYHLFKVDKNKIQCCVAHVVHSILNNIVDPESCVTMLNNIVDNIEQCGQHNIVQGCFHQPETSDNFCRAVSQSCHTLFPAFYISYHKPFQSRL